MQVVLVMFKSDGERRSFSLPRAVTVIGRREDCDLRIPLGEVSRKHCRLIQEGDSLRVEDLGSSNGTFHNNVRIQEGVVQPGDVIQVGSIAFVVQIDGVPTDSDVQPPRRVAARPPTAAQAEEAGATSGAVGFDPSDVLDDDAAQMEFDEVDQPQSGQGA
jgi:pSer/pThr/pTyr-binding forkhead associated (FHA) protein